MMTEPEDFSDINWRLKVSWFLWMLTLLWVTASLVIFYVKYPGQIINVWDAITLK